VCVLQEEKRAELARYKPRLLGIEAI